MGAFKRANWHSGLTYKQTCPVCNTTITYQDDKLDFRPWYPDGFIYCPTCNKPLRHREEYSLQVNKGKEVDLTKPNTKSGKFCPNCGTSVHESANFCSKCGTKF